MPWKVVADLVPERFGPREDVHRGPDARFQHQRSHGHVDVLATSHDRIEQRATTPAAHVVGGGLVTIGQQSILACDQTQLRTGDPGQRLEGGSRSEEHTSELQSRQYLVCRLLLEKKKKQESNMIDRAT